MRRYLYAMIPIGFILLVAAMVWIGRPTGGPVAPESQQIDTSPLDTSESPEPQTDEVVDPDTDSAGVPSPSGPEYRDNETVID
ncbi:hypothetical protein GCM10011363_37040 [Marivita lacus]|uniref:Secreted protein n=1 Tax=Marivita lacus TaxID=1323742 RepID=A0ABQ1L494_9RHOB|nr:hypothetical protein [Marivita lacus]GGC17134.1 hypothetical protein GCM10011363_37040 [Marivita lacus]